LEDVGSSLTWNVDAPSRIGCRANWVVVEVVATISKKNFCGRVSHLGAVAVAVAVIGATSEIHTENVITVARHAGSTTIETATRTVRVMMTDALFRIGIIGIRIVKGATMSGPLAIASTTVEVTEGMTVGMTAGTTGVTAGGMTVAGNMTVHNLHFLEIRARGVQPVVSTKPLAIGRS
jgi:hypothetical protein